MVRCSLARQPRTAQGEGAAPARGAWPRGSRAAQRGAARRGVGAVSFFSRGGLGRPRRRCTYSSSSALRQRRIAHAWQQVSSAHGRAQCARPGRIHTPPERSTNLRAPAQVPANWEEESQGEGGGAGRRHAFSLAAPTLVLHLLHEAIAHLAPLDHKAVALPVPTAGVSRPCRHASPCAEQPTTAGHAGATDSTQPHAQRGSEPHIAARALGDLAARRARAAARGAQDLLPHPHLHNKNAFRRQPPQATVTAGGEGPQPRARRSGRAAERRQKKKRGRDSGGITALVPPM